MLFGKVTKAKTVDLGKMRQTTWQEEFQKDRIWPEVLDWNVVRLYAAVAEVPFTERHVTTMISLSVATHTGVMGKGDTITFFLPNIEVYRLREWAVCRKRMTVKELFDGDGCPIVLDEKG